MEESPKLQVCAQLLRLLEFMECGKATEIKCSRWYSRIYIQNYSQCWEILGEEKRTEMLGSWLLSTRSSDLTLQKPADQLASTKKHVLSSSDTSWQHL